MIGIRNKRIVFRILQIESTHKLRQNYDYLPFKFVERQIWNYLALMNRLAAVFIIVLVFSLTALTAFFSMQPVKPLPVNAPMEVFSAERAILKLNPIVSRAHPTGSVANRKVRDYLVQELTASGLFPVIEQATMERKGGSYLVENIIAVKRGTAGSMAGKVLISAHYDARDLAPGAGDNGYAVAAVLETLRALQFAPPLKNDLVILFPDGEEMGSLGAKAFVRDNPLSDSIDLVLNFDGRGSSGISMMFETNRGNGWVIREFNKAQGSSFASSVSEEVSQLIPNYTDFTQFLTKAPSGLNFAHIGSVETYHSATDDIAHLDRGTVQSHGNSMLAAIFRYGNLDLKNHPSEDAVYFHVFFPGMIIYPVNAAIPLALIAVLLFIFVFWAGYRKEKISIGKTLTGFILFLGKIVIAVVTIFFLWKWLGPMNPDFGKYELDWVRHQDLYLAGFLLLSFLIVIVLHGKISRWLGPFNVAMGALFLWLILTIASALKFQGGSYLFLWPLIFSLLPLILFYFRKKNRKISLWFLALLMLFAIPGIYLFTQVLLLFYMTMTLHLAGVLAGMFVLLWGTLQLPLSYCVLFESER